MSCDSDIAIVGGSLAGLTLALACAARGVPVTVLERAAGRVRGGDSLSVDRAAIAATTGRDPRLSPTLPVTSAYRDLTTWWGLFEWLDARVAETPRISLVRGVGVSSVSDGGDGVELALDDGSQRRFSAVIGADGYRSAVRAAIMPDRPLARYAGYVVWRGLVEESRLSRSIDWPSDGGLWIAFVAGYRLVAAVLPGRDGSLEPGRRQVTFAWFDVGREALLRDTGCLTVDGHVKGVLGRTVIPADVRRDLARLAPLHWPELWREAVVVGIESADVLTGAPICEYQPERLAHGRLAVIGDAAHAVSPMTGAGYATSVDDAAILASSLAEGAGTDNVSATLARYQSARLPWVRGLVAQSRRISADFLRYAASHGRLVEADRV